MEGGGITSCCRRFDVRCIEDIIAIGALYRPGPMKFIDDYIARKKGLKSIEYAHPLLEQVCAETYGIMVYQEQVQRAANVLAGLFARRGRLCLRRAMGKKDRDKMAKERSRFVKGCARVNGIAEATANAIFDFIARLRNMDSTSRTARPTDGFRIKLPTSRRTIRLSLWRRCSRTTLQRPIAWPRSSQSAPEWDIKILAPDVNSSSLHFTPETLGQGYGHPLWTGLDQECWLRRHAFGDRRARQVGMHSDLSRISAHVLTGAP